MWIRASFENYTYAASLAVCLGEEYTHRYGKIHSSEKHARWLNSNIPTNFEKVVYTPATRLSNNIHFTRKGMIDIPLAMPDDSKSNDTVQSYRKYYLIHKKSFARWKSRIVPWWFSYINNLCNY